MIDSVQGRPSASHLLLRPPHVNARGRWQIVESHLVDAGLEVGVRRRHHDQRWPLARNERGAHCGAAAGERTRQRQRNLGRQGSRLGAHAKLCCSRSRVSVPAHGGPAVETAKSKFTAPADAKMNSASALGVGAPPSVCHQRPKFAALRVPGRSPLLPESNAPAPKSI